MKSLALEADHSLRRARTIEWEMAGTRLVITRYARIISYGYDSPVRFAVAPSYIVTVLPLFPAVRTLLSGPHPNPPESCAIDFESRPETRPTIRLVAEAICTLGQ
jgi:hypothetical protein